MKLILSLLILLILTISCNNSHDSENQLTTKRRSIDKEFINKFNFIFNNSLFLELSEVHFETAEEWKPNLMDDYQKLSFGNHYFFKFSSKDTAAYIHIEDNPLQTEPDSRHSIYFCYPLRNKWVINYFTRIECNVSFISEYGFDVTQKTDTIISRSDIVNSSLLSGKWLVDSCSDISKFYRLEFVGQDVLRTTMDDSNFIEQKYSLRESYFHTRDTLFLKLRCIILNEKNMILKDEKDGINALYYLSSE